MTVVAEVFSGLASGALASIGSLAKDIRTAITGEEAITGEKKGELLVMAAKLEAVLQTAEYELQKAQIQINALDAQSGSLFRGGWRPFAGWASAFGAVAYPMIRVILPWIIQVGGLIFKYDPKTVPEMPPLDTAEVMAVLGALLGFGGYRSFDKVKGTARR